MSLFVAAFGFGLVSMSVIALAAVGFTMQFGITNMINLAYGEVMIASAFVAYYLNQSHVSIWIAMLGGAVFGAVFSFLINRFIYAPFQRRGTTLIYMVIVSLAVSLMISNIMLPIVGYFSVSYRERFSHLLHIGSMALTINQLAIIGLAIAVMLVVHALLRYTRLGKAMRATAANPNLGLSQCHGCATEDVVTPHASFLTLDVLPEKAFENIGALVSRYPGVYGPYGFYDAVDPTTGAVGHRYLVLDQSMIMAALDNALNDRAMQRHFARDPISEAAHTYLSAETMSIH